MTHFTFGGVGAAVLRKSSLWDCSRFQFMTKGHANTSKWMCFHIERRARQTILLPPVLWVLVRQLQKYIFWQILVNTEIMKTLGVTKLELLFIC